MTNNSKTLKQLRSDVSEKFPELVEQIEKVVDQRLQHVAIDLANLSSYMRIQSTRIKPYREIK